MTTEYRQEMLLLVLYLYQHEGCRVELRAALQWTDKQLEDWLDDHRFTYTNRQWVRQKL